VTIVGGSYNMGWKAAAPDQFGGQPVTVSTFALDAHEVTVARFRQFWNAGHPTGPGVTYPNGDVLRAADEPAEPAASAPNNAYNWTPLPGDYEDFPINRVDWPTAFAFCAWDGGRLPTEAEWEYADTGREVGGLVGGRTYPWGETDPDCTLADTLECGWQRSAPVEYFPAFDGLYQMAGNVVEWCADSFQDNAGTCWSGSPLVNPLCHPDGASTHTIKGGSFTGSRGQIEGAWRMGVSGTAGTRGMRCARDLVLK
jgi:formylglycine-generating enzyme required for sulfatase activity